ncbi:MAG: cytochrome b/b6 domain-containing protein [Pseudomonadales bacterium]|nr:cytochrome b/b6 domain-containing protein [Pseudomonadales bacterium]
MKQNNIHYPVWDISTRLFHWLIVASFVISWSSFELGYMDVHAYSGYGMLGLLLFRIVWGVVGSPHSRFNDFVKGPGKTFQYLRGKLKDESVGHNPLGAYSVIVLLVLLSIQCITGLFNSDEILFDGPYRSSIDTDLADSLSAIHGQLFYFILGFIGLHLSAVCYYDLVKKQGLVRAMIIGRKQQSGRGAPVHWMVSLMVVIACTVAISLLLYLAPEPEYFY